LTVGEESVGGVGYDKENCSQNSMREIREKIRNNLEVFQNQKTTQYIHGGC
jgi:hypothetical protein